jgi:Mg2+-importing ATPase
VGIAALAAVVLVALHFSEQREFVRLAARARWRWLALALALQAATYPFQGGVWRVVTRAAKVKFGVATACKLAVARLFVDQALPSAGLSGTVLMVKSLEQLGIPRPVVMAGVVIDTASCYLTYAFGLAAALFVTLLYHQANRLILLAVVPFFLFAFALSFGFLTLSGRAAGRLAQRFGRLRPLQTGLLFLEQADSSLARRPWLLVQACLRQAAIVILDAATIWALIAALGFRASPAGVFASFMISTLFRLIAVAPGGLGVFDATSTLTLKMVGVDVAVALSATLLFRGLSFWLPMVPGLWFSRHAVKQRPNPS